MNITTKQYAQSLYETVNEAETDGALKVVLKNFIKLLAASNELGKADEIISEFGKIWNREQGIVEGELVSARELGGDVVKLLHEQIIKLLNVKEAKLELTVDKNILGGFVVRLDDMVIDGSVKKQLTSLKNKLTT